MEKPPFPRNLLFLAAGMVAAIVSEQFAPVQQRDLLLQWALMLWLVLLAFGLAGFQWALWINVGLLVCTFLACTAGLLTTFASGNFAANALLFWLGGMAVSAFYAWYILQSPVVKAWAAYMRERRGNAGI